MPNQPNQPNQTFEEELQRIIHQLQGLAASTRHRTRNGQIPYTSKLLVVIYILENYDPEEYLLLDEIENGLQKVVADMYDD